MFGFFLVFLTSRSHSEYFDRTQVAVAAAVSHSLEKRTRALGQTQAAGCLSERGSERGWVGI